MKASTTTTQLRKIAARLKRFRFIEARYAIYGMGITRVGARVWDLRHDFDWEIVTKKRRGKLALYMLVKAGKSV